MFQGKSPMSMQLSTGKTPGIIVALFGLLETVLPFMMGTTANTVVLTLGILTLLGGLAMYNMSKWGYLLAFMADTGLLVYSFAVNYNMVVLLFALILLFYMIYVAKDYGFAKRAFKPREPHYISDAERAHRHYVED
jgi:predicted membrane protein